jgi:hypothetical protein
MVGIIYSTWILQYIALATVGFFLGFLIRKLLDGPCIRTMKEQIKELTMHLMEAERLLSERAEGLWKSDTSSGIGDGYTRAVRDATTDQISEERIEFPVPEREEFEKTIVDLDIREAEQLSELSANRKVRIRKLSGIDTKIKLLTSFVGFEEERPVVGKKYRVFTQDGKVFSSSPVSTISGNFIRTKNSIYEIEEFMPSGVND